MLEKQTGAGGPLEFIAIAASHLPLSRVQPSQGPNRAKPTFVVAY